MMQWLLANKKILSYAAGAIAAAVSLYQLHDYIYRQGYNAATTEIQSRHNELIENQRKEYERKTQQAIDTLSADHAAEVERLRNEVKTEVITKEVIKYVTDTIEVPANCEPLAVNVVSVLNQATSIVSSATNGSAKSADTN